jgi:hypothetical protein
MYKSELRTCALGAIICVLLGAGIGYGWHYLDTSGRPGAVASAAIALAKQDAPSPPPSNPSPPREAAVVYGPLFPGLSRNPQPAESHPRCAKGHACGKHRLDRLGAASPPV